MPEQNYAVGTVPLTTPGDHWASGKLLGNAPNPCAGGTQGPLANTHWFSAFGLEPSLQRLWRSGTRLLSVYRAELLWIYTAPLPNPYSWGPGPKVAPSAHYLAPLRGDITLLWYVAELLFVVVRFGLGQVSFDGAHGHAEDAGNLWLRVA